MADEPSYPDIPISMLRRMGKAVRMGVGAALPLARLEPKPDGIIVGTANGGMEDCIKFLNQIIQYEEGSLTPTNFVQSTSNAIAGQIGILSENQGYNITHVHRGLAFENGVLDAAMWLKENPASTLLLGGLDEISSYNYNIDFLIGCFKEESIALENLYDSKTKGSVAGEGAAMFLVNLEPTNAQSFLKGMVMIHSSDEGEVFTCLKEFLEGMDDMPDLFLSGESGDVRQHKYVNSIESLLPTNSTIARFKHLTGDYPTASAISLWMAIFFIQGNEIPLHMIKEQGAATNFSRILIYNNYKDNQHSFMWVEKVQQ